MKAYLRSYGRCKWMGIVSLVFTALTIGFVIPAYLRSYGRCKWMGIVSLVFTALTIGFVIPGAIGVAGANRYNDTLLYLGLVDSLFALLFFVGWLMCQFEVDDAVVPVFEIRQRRNRLSSYASMRSTQSTFSTTSRELLTLSASNYGDIEKKA